jgi:hypothetical protein
MGNNRKKRDEEGMRRKAKGSKNGRKEDTQKERGKKDSPK